MIYRRLVYAISKILNFSIEDIFIFEESERKSRVDRSKGVV